MFWIVRLMFSLCTMMWKVGEFCRFTPWISARVQWSNSIKFGREQLHVHHGEPCPSMVPAPLMAISLTLEPVMKVVVPGQLLIGSIISVVLVSISRLTLAFRVIGPD